MSSFYSESLGFEEMNGGDVANEAEGGASVQENQDINDSKGPILAAENLCYKRVDLAFSPAKFDLPVGMGLVLELGGRVELRFVRVAGGGVKVYRSLSEYDFFTLEDLSAGVFAGSFPIFRDSDTAAFGGCEGKRALLVNCPGLKDEEVMIFGNGDSLWFSDPGLGRQSEGNVVHGPYQAGDMDENVETSYGALKDLKDQGAKYLWRDSLTIDSANLPDHEFQIGEVTIKLSLKLFAKRKRLKITYIHNGDEIKPFPGPITIPHLMRDPAGIGPNALPTILVGSELRLPEYWQLPLKLKKPGVEGFHAKFILDSVSGGVIVQDFSASGLVVRGPSVKHLMANTQVSVERLLKD